MELLSSLAIVAVAALLHASFQMSISVLTLLSSHTLGSKHSHKKLLRLIFAFLGGVGSMTLLLVSFVATVAGALFHASIPMVAWVTLCGLLFGLGISVWLFYYRKEQGTSLWIPRDMAKYLHDRTRATRNSGEAFGLGLSSVIGELLFIMGPVLVGAFALVSLTPRWQLVGIALYGFISLLPLLAVTALIGSGHKISRIQAWRENNKQFLQFIAGTGLFALAFYLYVAQVLAPAVQAAAGGLQ